MTHSLCATSLQKQTGLAMVKVFARLGSTNVRAAELISAGKIKAPACVLASLQTAGRGQRSNTWWSDAGSLTVTFVLDVDARVPAEQLSLRVGLAVHATLSRWISREKLQIKWPNDVLADGKKIAGILCQRVRDAVHEKDYEIIGIGLNVRTDLSQASALVQQRATSMVRLMSDPPQRDQVLVELTKNVLAIAAQNSNWLDEVNRLHALTGCDVHVLVDDKTIAGLCRGIDESGRLIVQDENEIHHLWSGIITQWSSQNHT